MVPENAGQRKHGFTQVRSGELFEFDDFPPGHDYNFSSRA